MGDLGGSPTDQFINRIYLAHPWARKEEGKALQTQIEALGIEVLNPFERGEQIIYNAKIKGSDGSGLSEEDCEQIVEKDLTAIDKSDATVAYLPEDAPILGSFMEIFYTAYCGLKPVVVFTNSDRYAGHPWIRYFCIIKRSEEELLEFLKEYTHRPDEP